MSFYDIDAVMNFTRMMSLYVSTKNILTTVVYVLKIPTVFIFVGLFLLLHVVVCYCMSLFVIACCCLLLHVFFCYCMLLFVIACCCLFRGSGIERYKLIKHFLKYKLVHVRTNGRIARSYTYFCFIA